MYMGWFLVAESYHVHLETPWIVAPYCLLHVHFSPVSNSLMSGLALFIFLLPSSSVNYYA